MKTEGRARLRRQARQSLFLLAAAWVFSACAGPKGEPLALATTPGPAVESHVGEIKLENSAPDPVSVTEGLLTDTRARLAAVPRDPEFNGYFDLVGVAKTRDGLLAHRKLDSKTLRKALAQSFRAKEGAKATALSRDLRAIVHAINKPVLSAPVDIASHGEARIDGEKAVTEVVSAFICVPQSLDGVPDPLVRLDAAYFSLMTARQVATGAATRDHYLAALALENAALDQVAKVVKAGELEIDDLRDIIAQLQTRSSGQQEYLPVLDNEYLRAAQQLQSTKSQPKADSAAKAIPLANFYLFVRHEVLQDQAPAEEDATAKAMLQSPPAPWMSDLALSRETYTHKSAVELLAALEAFKLVNGHYPGKLEELIPSVLTRVPANLLETDKAFQYSVKDGKVKLSSNSGDGRSRVW